MAKLSSRCGAPDLLSIISAVRIVVDKSYNRNIAAVARALSLVPRIVSTFGKRIADHLFQLPKVRQADSVNIFQPRQEKL